ncbi:MAG: 4Fe-4S dicluster domain-containing protein [Anaerolineaceae bacterium]|nr:4Fe-4S dicluster domain-containing protein [Anaerolineaceae bacterium]
MVMKRGDDFEIKELPKEIGELPTVYVDDMLMSLKYFLDEEEAHLWIKDQNVCAQCKYKPCLYFCPVGVYSACGSDGQQTQVAYQACVECASCRVGCPYSNIGWKLPRGGFGVAYKFG